MYINCIDIVIEIINYYTKLNQDKYGKINQDKNDKK
jgi:hypothetical protein